MKVVKPRFHRGVTVTVYINNFMEQKNKITSQKHVLETVVASSSSATCKRHDQS